MPTETKSSVAVVDETASDDKSSVVVELSERLAAEVLRINNLVSDSQTYNAAVEPLIRPLMTLKQNGEQAPDASINALEAICAACESRWDASASEAFVDFLERVDFFVDLLAPVSLDNVGTGLGATTDDLLERIIPLAGLMFTVSEEALAAATLAREAWHTTLETLATAQTPEHTASDVPSRTGKRTGQWVQDHGWEVAYTSDKSHVTYGTGSNEGAMQHDICKRYAEDHRVPKPSRGQPIWIGIQDGLKYILNPNTKHDAAVSVPGFVLTRRDVPR